MFNELICVNDVNGVKKLSVSKILARVTYLVLGFGSGIGGRILYRKFKK